jgi:carbamoyl-phosphate synthase large subunit
MKILITGACAVTSRAIARSLNESDALGPPTLAGSDIGANPFGFFEGLFERIYRVPRFDEPGYEEAMRHLMRTEDVDAAIVVPEHEVLFWSSAGMPVPALLPPPAIAQLAISKERLYRALDGTGLAPWFEIVARDLVASRVGESSRGLPLWLRDGAEGSTSGRGALAVSDETEAAAWVVLNPGVERFLLSEFLPGRNFACCLLFVEGEMLKSASYERLEYFMAKTAPSGITGNISKGRLVSVAEVDEAAERAVRHVAAVSGEEVHGLFTVDLRENRKGRPLVTEINIRHTAATSAFASGGMNMAEAQVLAAIGDLDAIGPQKGEFPPDNLILRDIDGVPIWLEEYREAPPGGYYARRGGAPSG